MTDGPLIPVTYYDPTERLGVLVHRLDPGDTSWSTHYLLPEPLVAEHERALKALQAAEEAVTRWVAENKAEEQEPTWKA